MARKTLNIPLGIDFIANIPARMLVEVNNLLDGKDVIDIAISDK